ncbi:MAG: hypothetical protein HYS21_03670 [Deltaproteobacteria bacterium]|nr:hypothetical protein [Deltaproteobacteria bacterium]
MKTESEDKRLLILLENGIEYAEFRKVAGQYEGFQKTVCALTPFAVHYCENNGIPFILPEECFNGEDISYQEDSEALIKELVERLNEYCVSRSMEKIKFPLEIGNYFFLQLYVVIGSLHFKSFLLKKVIEQVRPEAIISFVTRKPMGMFLGFRSDPRVNAFHELLLNSPYKERCRFLIYEFNKKEPIGKRLIGTARDKARSLFLKFPLLQKYYFLRRNGINPLDMWGKGKPKVLVVGSLYNWKYVFRHPWFKDKAVMTWTGGERIPSGKRPSGDIFKEWLGWDNRFLGFNLSALLGTQMAMIEATFERLMRTTSHDIEKMKGIGLVVSSAFSYPMQNHIANIAKFLGKPVVIYQHGEMNLYRDALFTKASELLYADYYLSFGEGVGSKYAEFEGNHRFFKKAVPVGSASLDRLKNSNGTDGYILYATGKYLLNSHPFIFTTGIDNRLYNSQKKILSFLEGVAKDGKHKVIWKLNNTHLHSEVPFKAAGVNVVHFEKSFVELLNEACLVILDAPATTSLEVCCTVKPLFVLLNRSKWLKEPEELLRRRAVVAYTPEELVEKVGNFLENGSYSADLHDREFIKKYGTCKDDGNSAQRALEFISSVLERRPAETDAICNGGHLSEDLIAESGSPSRVA